MVGTGFTRTHRLPARHCKVDLPIIKRAKALAAHVSRWDDYDDPSWLGWVELTFDLGQPIQVFDDFDA